MPLRKALILIAAIWALSLPAFLIAQQIRPSPPMPRVSYINYMLFVLESENGEPEFSTSHSDEVVYIVNLSFAPRSTRGIFRPWNEVRLPEQCRIDIIGNTQLTHNQVKDTLLKEAHNKLLQPNPPAHFIDMRDLVLLEAVETNQPVYLAELPHNISHDLLASGWICGALLLELLFLTRTPDIFKRVRAYLRVRQERCASCGYPLADLPTRTCPECGPSTSAQQ